MTISLTQECPLFTGVAESELAALLDCLQAKQLHYEKDEFILLAGNPVTDVGIVLSGSVQIIQEDIWGNRSILAHISPGGLFAEAFSCAVTKQSPVSVRANESSDILLINYQKIITVCSSACVFHSRLISNMLRVLASKNIMLTKKLEFVTQRSTREKVLSYLSECALKADSKDFSIEYSRQELADYLSVDRSALSRELAQMKKEGVLDYSKNSFVLY